MEAMLLEIAEEGTEIGSGPCVVELALDEPGILRLDIADEWTDIGSPPVLLEILLSNPEIQLIDIGGPPGNQGFQGSQGNQGAAGTGFQGPQGFQGRPGSPGSGGDKTFRWVQDIPSMTATVNHGLGKYPSVTIKDTLGTQLEGSVTYLDDNNVTINLSAVFAWTADFN